MELLKGETNNSNKEKEMLSHLDITRKNEKVRKKEVINQNYRISVDRTTVSKTNLDIVLTII